MITHHPLHALLLCPTTYQALSDILTGLKTATGARLTAQQRVRHYEMAEATLKVLSDRWAFIRFQSVGLTKVVISMVWDETRIPKSF
jgi:hypothetical protein